MAHAHGTGLWACSGPWTTPCPRPWQSHPPPKVPCGGEGELVWSNSRGHADQGPMNRHCSQTCWMTAGRTSSPMHLRGPLNVGCPTVCKRSPVFTCGAGGWLGRGLFRGHYTPPQRQIPCAPPQRQSHLPRDALCLQQPPLLHLQQCASCAPPPPRPPCTEAMITGCRRRKAAIHAG